MNCIELSPLSGCSQRTKLLIHTSAENLLLQLKWLGEAGCHHVWQSECVWLRLGSQISSLCALTWLGLALGGICAEWIAHCRTPNLWEVWPALQNHVSYQIFTNKGLIHAVFNDLTLKWVLQLLPGSSCLDKVFVHIPPRAGRFQSYLLSTGLRFPSFKWTNVGNDASKA